MIIRVFQAQLRPAARPAYERLRDAVSVPLMREQPGCLTTAIGPANAARPADFVFVSVWRDLASLRAFVGEHWQEVTILPGEADLLETVSVAHDDESYRSLVELWRATKDVVQRREMTALDSAYPPASYAFLCSYLRSHA